MCSVDIYKTMLRNLQICAMASRSNCVVFRGHMSKELVRTTSINNIKAQENTNDQHKYRQSGPVEEAPNLAERNQPTRSPIKDSDRRKSIQLEATKNVRTSSNAKKASIKRFGKNQDSQKATILSIDRE